MNRTTFLFALGALFAPVSLTAADDDLAVVVNKSNALGNLTKSQLRKLVLGEQSTWPGGQKVVVALRAPGNPERDGVLRNACRMSEDDYTQHTMHANFSGESGTPPKVMASAAAIRKWVAATPGAIAFLRASDVDASVKVVGVEGLSPGEPGYKIKCVK